MYECACVCSGQSCGPLLAFAVGQLSKGNDEFRVAEECGGCGGNTENMNWRRSDRRVSMNSNASAYSHTRTLRGPESFHG